MQFRIDDPQAIAVLKELAFRLNVTEEAIIQAATRELVKQYTTRPTTSTHYVKTVLKRQGRLI